MGKDHKLPELADQLYEKGPLGIVRRMWISSSEGWSIDMFGREESFRLNEDLEVWRKMPGWFAIGQDADDALLCVDSKSGSCAMVEVDNISCGAAQEIAKTLGELLAQGEWK